MIPEPCDPSSSNLPTPPLVQGHYPYEVNVIDEHETLVHKASAGQGPPAALTKQQHYPTPLPDALIKEYFSQPRSTSVMNPVLFKPGYRPLSSFVSSTIPVTEHDRRNLSHFVDNVLRVAFPILEVHPQGPDRVRTVLRSLQTNPPYFHSCLCIAAIHRKTALNLTGGVVEQDIMRHRTAAIEHLAQAIKNNVNHEQTLDAALAMIFFHCSAGTPEDEELSYIPWHWHFQAVMNNMDRLGLMETTSCIEPAFNTSLTSWIDIFGATMLGRMPLYANEYRAKYLSGTSSGLKELMGCDDRIMYLISEIACLDSLKVGGRIEDFDICRHVSALNAQIAHTEPINQTLESPYFPTGSINPKQLTKNVSALFRVAARIYLHSLMPGFDQNQLSTISLVSAAAEILQFIPTGSDGFDLSLVWPLLITGAFSVQSSSFRGILHDRVKTLGDLAENGNFNRMYGLLQKVWKLSDDPAGTLTADTDSSLPSPNLRRDVPFSPCIGPLIKKQQVHWRDVMRRNNWSYLLI